jgi:ABC-type glycerol-3-phosphate transport system permease component
MLHNSPARKTVLLAISTVIAFVYLFPYTWMVLTGFRRPIDTITMPPRFFFTPTLDGFRYLFQTVQFQFFLLNSAVVASSSTVLVILIAAPAAYALAHLPIRGRVFLMLIIVARMVPGITIVVPAYLIATKSGQLDTYQILILIYLAFNLPFAIWLMRSFFRDIHPGIREAAIIDGASEFQVFRRIMLPLAISGVVATGVFVFIAAWNEFLFALVLTNSRAATAPLAMLGFRTQWGVLWAEIGAASVLVSTPVLVFALFMQKYLLRGLTMGSIK